MKSAPPAPFVLIDQISCLKYLGYLLCLYHGAHFLIFVSTAVCLIKSRNWK
ncbi:hypothetical protein L873DRAFT_341672 [Choiromyces venosus 120613-1]|uniref:Uncharacterized protein n=1 Tax=Choiromyces venosus 120613-1 TaxID=1336337 RepID=A0A3N4J247_9PEZI|nr:hypothetical protein L873DRAFT_341672 [Choiromyces venosus 120613-1]